VCGAFRTGAFAEKDGYAYTRCAACGFVFLDPMPDAAELARQYTTEDNAIDADAYPKAASRFRRARVKALRFVRYIRGRDAIDIGCGGGFMVEAMRRVGARAAGLDISPQAIAYAERQFPKNRFFCENVAAFEGRNLAFDFVYSSEVIEHVPDATRYMALLARITRPGGHVYITTPDIGHWRVPGEVTRWDVFSPPVHVQFFNRRCLGLLLERHDFRVRRRFIKLKPGLQILAVRN
jgi:SAM-dependent methyltransferase